jgi:SagB-type dehydrogenase family enzyme
MQHNHMAVPVAVAIIAVMLFAGSASGQGQVPPMVVPTPILAGPQEGSPPVPPPGRGAGRQGREGQGSRRGGWVHATPHIPTGLTVKLPAPKAKSETSLEQALWNRRTLRAVTVGQLTLEEVGQLLWAAQGITGEYARRAAPSLAAAYPLEVILVAGDVAGLPAGTYRYYPTSNEVERLALGDRRHDLGPICKFNGIEQAPAVVAITGVESRLSSLMQVGATTHHIVAIEAGAAAQNLALEAVALGLGTAVVPDSDEAKLVRILQTPPDEKPFVVVVISRQ